MSSVATADSCGTIQQIIMISTSRIASPPIGTSPSTSTQPLAKQIVPYQVDAHHLGWPDFPRQSATALEREQPR